MSGPRHPGLLSQPCLFAGCRFCQILHKHGLPAALDSPIRWINYACAAKHSIRLIQLAIPQRWKVWVDILSTRLYCARHWEGEIKHFEGDIRYFGGEIKHLEDKIKYFEGESKYMKGEIRYMDHGGLDQAFGG